MEERRCLVCKLIIDYPQIGIIAARVSYFLYIYVMSFRSSSTTRSPKEFPYLPFSPLSIFSFLLSITKVFFLFLFLSGFIALFNCCFRFYIF